jgi:hypothetical protein
VVGAISVRIQNEYLPLPLWVKIVSKAAKAVNAPPTMALRGGAVVEFPSWALKAFVLDPPT